MGALEATVAKFDDLLSRERFAEAGELLRVSIGKSADAREKTSLYNELMGFERQYGTDENAVKAAENALSLLEREELSDSKPAAYVFLNAATVYSHAGGKETALAYYRRAETLFTRYYPPGAKDFAGLYNNMASCYSDETSWRTAAYYYERAAGILARQGDLCDLSVTYYNLAALYARFEPASDEVSRFSSLGRRLLDAPEDQRDAYYYYTCRKAAAASATLGLFADEEAYRQRADAFYERDRTQ